MCVLSLRSCVPWSPSPHHLFLRECVPSDQEAAASLGLSLGATHWRPVAAPSHSLEVYDDCGAGPGQCSVSCADVVLKFCLTCLLSSLSPARSAGAPRGACVPALLPPGHRWTLPSSPAPVQGGRWHPCLQPLTPASVPAAPHPCVRASSPSPLLCLTWCHMVPRWLGDAEKFSSHPPRLVPAVTHRPWASTSGQFPQAQVGSRSRFCFCCPGVHVWLYGEGRVWGGTWGGGAREVLGTGTCSASTQQAGDC